MPRSIREATLEDRQRLANLIHFEVYVHRHLDWRPALDWLNYKPYLVLESDEQLHGVLACPVDEPEIPWIRLFAARSNSDLREVWQMLWEAAWDELTGMGARRAAAIVMQGWFRLLLEESGFAHTDNIVVLLWESGNRALPAPKCKLSIRDMVPEDLEAVYHLDTIAFEYEWRNSARAIELAYGQSSAATVIEDGQKLVGYQISTTSMGGGHLARLAVHPETRNQGIGYALVYQLLEELQKRGVHQVTVNTQQDNVTSLALYARAGFRKVEEQYQVYQYLDS
jgi:ribosomal-protein-alanine N-acetyltransferase